MKIRNYLSITFFVMTITLSCNQTNTKKQKSNEYEQIPRKEQGQMPEQSEQNTAPHQQPSQTSKVSDKELEQFAEAVQQVQIINQEIQQKMMSILEEKGMDVQRFNEIQQAQQNPQQKIDATNKEMEKYDTSILEFEKLQAQAQQKMQKKITETGLKMSRYEKITVILQSDPDLQEKFQMIQQQN